ncbi:polysaccharide deacetylase family protein [Plectonema cf. radiosum LEGE 06105]|uniref:Polysaccharide deacetylase family protein n=1 Tax=Plectonema cf. radiosum LEGE 06105 TaxID=945769 RepID=A0A8J7FES4_9CYAN|nr:polysaccharide deacetylase family protein [Plectonema radiosum]MBE9216159.1 polysaccharide deacetylase family protein [Plectonema cf. radiosum LEGE 06105]
MENKKSLALPQGILIALTALCGSFVFGLMLPIKQDSTNIGSKQQIKVKNITAESGSLSRINGFKGAMLTTWQQEAISKGVFHTVPKQFRGTTIKQANLAPNDKLIALTFDDGPWPEYTAQVLEILKKNDIKATFFVVGQVLNNYPDLGKRIVSEGHTIGNHTWHHWYHFFNKQAAALEIDRTSDLIYKTTGTRTTLFRPPGGMLHNGLAAYAQSKDYTVVMWSADSMDYARPPAATLVSRVMKQASPGGIVLLHDGGGPRKNTVAALPSMISNLKNQGYRFVTIPELLEHEEKQKKKNLVIGNR